MGRGGLGSVTDTGTLRLFWHGQLAGELPVDPLTEGAPVYDRHRQRPADLDALQAFDPATLPAPADLGSTLLQLVARPTIASNEWVYRQYDQMARLGTVVRPGGDAAVVRVEGKKGGPSPPTARRGWSTSTLQGAAIEGALKVPVQALARVWRTGLIRVLGLADSDYPDEVASTAAPV
ncbi:hypothetical protein [Vulgatibacter incomptus]|uniref:hypothetical protein n=1 Tax=Vulgatibacter incomptus TaxID=1391653 RepID=UPI0006800E38|nr:hypothetical protein [Vulgatibacter incomptus]